MLTQKVLWRVDQDESFPYEIVLNLYAFFILYEKYVGMRMGGPKGQSLTRLVQNFQLEK